MSVASIAAAGARLQSVARLQSIAGKTTNRRPLAVLARLFKLDVDQASREIGSIAPFLIPFVKMACVYFVLDLPEEDPSPTAAFVKALPVLSLAWLVCLHGVRHGNAPRNFVNYNRRILYGLLFSICGDVALIWQEQSIYFLLGMLSFACAHLCYIMAFGFRPFGVKEFIPSLVGLVAAMGIIYPCVKPGLMAWLVPIYGILLAVMGWRSLACFTLSGEVPWKKILCAIGAFLFVISDTFVGINKFCYPIPFERTLIMVTYYAAQLCISLSVINFHLSSGTEVSPSDDQPVHQIQMQRLSGPGRLSPPQAMPQMPRASADRGGSTGDISLSSPSPRHADDGTRRRSSDGVAHYSTDPSTAAVQERRSSLRQR